jgi:hypothetical protein
METVTTALVNATPRSNKYKYYTVGVSAYTAKKSESQIPIDDRDSIIYNIPTFADLPAEGSDYYIYVAEND